MILSESESVISMSLLALLTDLVDFVNFKLFFGESWSLVDFV